MTDYPNFNHTKAVLASAVANPAAPTLAEIAAGVAISADMPFSGINTTVTTTTVDRTPWSGTHVVVAPLHIDVSIELTAYSRTQPNAEALWAAVPLMRARKFLIVRRGIPALTAFAATQVVEVFTGRVGKRRRLSDPDGFAFYAVPFFTTTHNDAAVIP